MKVTTAEAAQAIKEAHGFITVAAKKLGIHRSQLHNLINAHPTVKAALTDAREEMKDFAEGKLFANIQEGKEASVFFYLKCQAKDRGYVEKAQIEFIQKELDGFLDLLEKQLEPQTYERILNLLANSG